MVSHCGSLGIGARVVVEDVTFVFLVKDRLALAVALDRPAGGVELDRLRLRVWLVVVLAVFLERFQGLRLGGVVGAALVVGGRLELPAAFR